MKIIATLVALCGAAWILFAYIAGIQNKSDHIKFKQIASVLRHCFAWDAGGRILVSGGEDGTIRLWDVVSAELLRTVTGHNDQILSIAISPDGGMVASGGIDKTIKLWDISRVADSTR